MRLLDTRATGAPLGQGGVRDLVVAGAGPVPAPGTAVVLNVTAVGATAASTDVRVYPTLADGRVPGTSNLNASRGQTVANAVLATVGRDGRVRLRNALGAVHLVVDLAGWYGPSGEGWDVSWPQCTAAGSTASRLPVGGAFAVVGLTRGRPLAPNECFAAQWAWAETLPGEPAVYLNVNAPGNRTTPDALRWVALCGTGQATSDVRPGVRRRARPATPSTACRRSAGTAAGRWSGWTSRGRTPTGRSGRRATPAPSRSTARCSSGAVDTLRAAGHRVGIYTDRGSSAANDWRDIMGDYRLTQTQNWVFRAPTADGAGALRPGAQRHRRPGRHGAGAARPERRGRTT